MTTSLVLQLGGTLLTIVGLTFTVTQPLFTRIDTLTLAVARIEERSNSNSLTSAETQRRLTRIENDLYTLQRNEYASRQTDSSGSQTPRP